MPTCRCGWRLGRTARPPARGKGRPAPRLSTRPHLTPPCEGEGAPRPEAEPATQQPQHCCSSGKSSCFWKSRAECRHRGGDTAVRAAGGGDGGGPTEAGAGDQQPTPAPWGNEVLLPAGDPAAPVPGGGCAHGELLAQMEAPVAAEASGKWLLAAGCWQVRAGRGRWREAQAPGSIGHRRVRGRRLAQRTAR